MCALLLSCVWLYMTHVAHQACLSLGFLRQEYSSGLPFPPPQASWPRDWTLISCISCISRWILYHCATWETLCILLTGIKNLLWNLNAKSNISNRSKRSSCDWLWWGDQCLPSSSLASGTAKGLCRRGLWVLGTEFHVLTPGLVPFPFSS